MRAIDLVGKVIGRWTIVARGENTRQGGTQWLCRCECGNEKTINGIVLRDGRSKSCGCLHRESCIERSTKHGHSPMYGKISPTYHTWAGMKARCTNPKNNHFYRYGARGITVCERWLNFGNFLADMGEKPDGLSLDRIDNDRGYEPGNCRWASHTDQARNKSNNRLITVAGKTQTMQEWSEEIGISYGTISWRLQRGWSDEESLFGRDRLNGCLITFNGATKSVKQWCSELKLKHATVYWRFNHGWRGPECLFGRGPHTS